MAGRGRACPRTRRSSLFVGRLVRDKGVDVLLEPGGGSAARPTPSLCIVGDGPLPTGRATPAAASSLAGRDASASGCRSRTPPADTVVVPSIATRRFLEPWGLVCNEAMYAGHAR